MIISRTPYRLSFFGGGTDYPNWYEENGGQVLATTIDKYLYISCRNLPPFFKHRVRLVYSAIEECGSVSELKHPSAREVARYLGFNQDLEIHYDGDLPGRSGMGSSSAFTVGLLNALHAHKGESVTAKQLASEGTFIEQKIIKESVGSQDQYISAFGGFKKIRFGKSGQVDVDPITLKQDRLDELNDNLMLCFTGIVRTASLVAETYVHKLNAKGAQLTRLHQMVDEAVDMLNSDADLKDFGKLLDESWHEKRALSHNISSDHIDEIYERAISSGALGGKITGAGGGGMMLLFVPEKKQPEVRAALPDVLWIPFRFSTRGSQIIFLEG